MLRNPEFVHPVLPMATAVGEQLDDEPSLDKEWADELMALKIQLRASQARAFSKQKAVLLKEIKALDAAEGGGGGDGSMPPPGPGGGRPPGGGKSKGGGGSLRGEAQRGGVWRRKGLFTEKKTGPGAGGGGGGGGWCHAAP